jgi:hypothetical protein
VGGRAGFFPVLPETNWYVKRMNSSSPIAGHAPVP